VAACVGAIGCVCTGAVVRCISPSFTHGRPLSIRQIHRMLEVGNSMAQQPRHSPLDESRWWMCVKHAAQLALVAAVMLFVVRGGEAPLMCIAWIGAAFTGLGSIVLVDRQRFRDAGFIDQQFDVVHVITPNHGPLTLDGPIFVPAHTQQHVAEVPFLASVT